MAKLIRYLILLGAILPLQGFAQPAAAPDDVSVDFTVFAYNEQIPQLHFRIGKAFSPELVFNPTYRSVRYHYQGPRHMVFARAVAVTERGIPPVFQSVADVEIPTGARRLLLIFLRTKDPGREFSIVPLDDGPEHLPMGHGAIFNATGYDLAATIGATTTTLRGGPSVAFKVSHSIHVSCAIISGEKAYGAFDSSLECGADERVILLLYPPRYKGSPFVQYGFLREVVEKPTAKAKQSN